MSVRYSKDILDVGCLDEDGFMDQEYQDEYGYLGVEYPYANQVVEFLDEGSLDVGFQEDGFVGQDEYECLDQESQDEYDCLDQECQDKYDCLDQECQDE